MAATAKCPTTFPVVAGVTVDGSVVGSGSLVTESGRGTSNGFFNRRSDANTDITSTNCASNSVSTRHGDSYFPAGLANRASSGSAVSNVVRRRTPMKPSSPGLL